MKKRKTLKMTKNRMKQIAVMLKKKGKKRAKKKNARFDLTCTWSSSLSTEMMLMSGFMTLSPITTG